LTHEMFIQGLRRAVREKVAPVAVEVDRSGAMDPGTISLFWDLGLLQILLPEENGGFPENPVQTLCAAIEEIARCCASSALLLVIQAVGKPEDKCGFRGSNTADVVLEDVAVPLECRIGNEGDGFNIAMQDFDMSRPAVGALAVGIAQGALDIAANYAQQRKTFGKHLMDHQAIQFMLADAAMNIEAGRGLVEKSSKAFDNGERNTMLASMAKCF